MITYMILLGPRGDFIQQSISGSAVLCPNPASQASNTLRTLDEISWMHRGWKK
jgi:hypothetical protein